MITEVTYRQTDYPVSALALLGILALSLFIQSEFDTRQAILLLLGIGFGVTLFHAAFGFTGGWRRFIRARHSEGVRAQILLLGLTSLLFFPVLGKVVPGIEASGAIAPVGFSVLLGAFLFGIGMQLGGGCGSGTLYTMGQGQVDMLITLAFFIVGATLGSAHLHWWLALGDLGTISLIKEFGWLPGLLLQFFVLTSLYLLVRRLDMRRHAKLQPLLYSGDVHKPGERLLFGPWPLFWGVVALALLNLLTLLFAGHPWSITFAFGLWGSKIWSALGGEAASWPYWSSGYPAQALHSSVLADTTSLMDIGLIIGALLAAALAGKFAPAMKLSTARIVAAVAGGLLLGYGARLAFGCNIGALLAGISSGSVHGWLWFIAAFIGSYVGVHIRVLMGLDKPWRQAP